MRNSDDTYTRWSHSVDMVLQDLCGLVQADLPDWNSRDAYDDEMTVEDAAQQLFDDLESGDIW